MENNIKDKKETVKSLQENVQELSRQQAFLVELNRMEVQHQRREHELHEQLNQLREELHKSPLQGGERMPGFQKSFGGFNPNYSFHTGEDIYARFRFPWEAVESGSRIVIYGGGIVGRTFMEQLAKASYCNIVAICDKNPAQTGIYELPVITLRELSRMRPEEYDMVLIAIEKKSVAIEIKGEIEMAGIPMEKVRWFDPAKR